MPNLYGNRTEVRQTEYSNGLEVLNVANYMQSFIEEYSQITNFISGKTLSLK